MLSSIKPLISLLSLLFLTLFLNIHATSQVLESNSDRFSVTTENENEIFQVCGLIPGKEYSIFFNQENVNTPSAAQEITIQATNSCASFPIPFTGAGKISVGCTNCPQTAATTNNFVDTPILVTPNFDPEQLVNDYLFEGSCFDITNIQGIGNFISLGQYSGAEDILSLNTVTGETDVLQGDTVTYTAETTTAVGDQLFWYVPAGGDIIGANNEASVTVVWTETGSFNLALGIVSAANCFPDGLALVINVGDVINAVDGLDLSGDIQLFPNPVAHSLTIKTEMTIKQIRLIDLAGRVLRNYDNQTILDMAWLPAGIYFVEMETAEGIWTEKVVKL